MAVSSNVLFSTSAITLRNKYKVGVNPSEKRTYFVTNKDQCSRRIKVALSEKSDAVSYWLECV